MSKRPLVIVAVDGSHETERVVEYAVSVARVRSAELQAVQVVPRYGSLWCAPVHERELIDGFVTAPRLRRDHRALAALRCVRRRR